MNFGKRSVSDSWPDMIIPDSLQKKNNYFDREFMNFGKRIAPFERSLIYSNKKSGVDPNAFNREFLSFGKRLVNTSQVTTNFQITNE